MSTSSKIKLWLSFDGIPRLALSIPLAICGTFAVNPLKWLRFLGFAIYGREGYLSTSEAGPEINDYTANIEARSYYFVSEGEARFVDVDAVDDRSSDASYLTHLQRDFRESLIARDGTCVITNDIAVNCIGCHILPHSKGSDYISNVVRYRRETYDFNDDLNDINDTRNGLLLFSALHRPFGAGEIAFLKTPNFGLTVDDIDYHPANEADESSVSRLTLHYFVPPPHLATRYHKWPPAIIVDVFYAAAALNAWSSSSFFKYARKNSRDAYYEDDQDDGNPLDGSGSRHVDAQTDGQATGQSGSERYPLHSRNKTSNIPTDHLKDRRFTDWLDCVNALWMQSSRVGKPKPEGVCTSSLARNDGIKMWLQSMEDSLSS